MRAKTEENLKLQLKWMLPEKLKTKTFAVPLSLSMKTTSKVHLKTSKSHSLLDTFMQNI